MGGIGTLEMKATDFPGSHPLSQPMKLPIQKHRFGIVDRIFLSDRVSGGQVGRASAWFFVLPECT